MAKKIVLKFAKQKAIVDILGVKESQKWSAPNVMQDSALQKNSNCLKNFEE